jgi:SAM-dependent methyltransferase
MDARICCQVPADARATPPKGVSEQLLKALESGGIGGRSVIDVGCGAGGLCLALLDRGAASVLGVDLSPQAIDQARRASRLRGLADRAAFRVADGSQVAFDRADVVVLDKVYCCYFDAAALLANTLPAAMNTYAIVLPPSRGVRGAIARSAIGLENLGRRLKGDQFRAYVHDVAGLDAAIREAGFQAVLRRRRLLWEIRIYARAVRAPRVVRRPRA